MKARNPVLPPEYHCPDGEPHFINGELFVYPSYDEKPGSYCSDKLYVAHSKDLADWQLDGPAFTCADIAWDMILSYPAGLEEASSYAELPSYIRDYLPGWFCRVVPIGAFKAFVMWLMRRMQSKDRARRMLYAPDALTVGDKSYLFFCTSDGGEGVAVSDSPAGPFQNPVQITLDRSGEPIKGIDPAVFRDDDGKVYLYWGQINSFGAQLTDDLTQVKEDTLVQGLLTEKEHCFHEGSSMRKIGDTYYYIFADTHRGKPTALGYATSKSPLGPFTYRGVIVDNDGCDPETWNNHGSIECVHGQWHVFYHRSTGNSRYLRRMCAEPICIDENGLIAEVPVTSIGMGEPYRIGETLPGYQACQVENAWIDNDCLVVNKGKAKVVFRYVDMSETFSAISCDSRDVEMTWQTNKKGELTLFLEASQRTEIRSFMLQK